MTLQTSSLCSETTDRPFPRYAFPTRHFSPRPSRARPRRHPSSDPSKPALFDELSLPCPPPHRPAEPDLCPYRPPRYDVLCRFNLSSTLLRPLDSPGRPYLHQIMPPLLRRIGLPLIAPVLAKSCRRPNPPPPCLRSCLSSSTCCPKPSLTELCDGPVWTPLLLAQPMRQATPHQLAPLLNGPLGRAQLCSVSPAPSLP
jgi:hypothetical protein